MRINLSKIILKKNREIPFVNGHPWIFSGAIEKSDKNINDGDEVAVYTNANQFVAYGLFNSKSQIRVRLYSWEIEKRIDKYFFEEKIKSAIHLRKNILNTYNHESATRLIFSEGDGISGLTVDKFSNYLVIQVTSFAIAKRLDEIIELLIKFCEPKGIYLRTEKGIGESEGLVLEDKLLWGEIPQNRFTIIENDIIYEIDLQTGQKTGFYIDQQENRKSIKKFIKDKNVLDLCCYTGGFSLNAAKYGAKSVIGVDVSQSALQIAERNVILNNLKNISFEKSDAFKYLEQIILENKKFDVIILDPPKFSQSKSSTKNALKGYIELNKLAMQILNPNGILITCSCSGRVSREEFYFSIQSASQKASKVVQVLESRGQSQDHPVSIFCPESNYLKCFILRVF